MGSADASTPRPAPLDAYSPPAPFRTPASPSSGSSKTPGHGMEELNFPTEEEGDFSKASHAHRRHFFFALRISSGSSIVVVGRLKNTIELPLAENLVCV